MSKLGEAVIFLLGNNSGLQKTLKETEGEVKGWSSGVAGNIKAALTGALVGGGVAIAGGLAAAGVAAFGMAQETKQATNDMQASLGLTAEEAQRLGGVAREVFKNNFGDSIGEATAVLGELRKQLGGMEMDDAGLQAATESAFRLKDVFGVDTKESINAVRTLMENFGLSSQQSFDFLAKGFQSGLNSSDDFLDTIGEYSTQFANGGADAGNFFSLLQSGLQGGMLGTDKAADSFKEFRVRIQDGSKTTAAGLAQLGIDSDALAQRMASGQTTAAQAWELVMGKLRDTKDENVRMQAGVALLGSQFEDLGTDAALALSLTRTKLDDLAGATGSLDAKYNSLGAAMEGMKRQALVALAPIGDKLLGLANDIMPSVQAGFAWFADVLPGIMDAVGGAVGGVIDVVKALAGYLSPDNKRDLMREWFGDAGPIIDEVVRGLKGLLEVVRDNLQPILIGLGAMVAAVIVPAFWAWVAATWAAVPAMWAALAPVLAAMVPVLALGAAVALLAVAWQNNWGDIQGKTEAVWNVLQPIFQAIFDTLAKFWTEIEPRLAAAWTNIRNFIEAAWTFIWGSVLEPGINGLVTFWTDNWGTIQGILEAVWQVIQGVVEVAWAIISGVITLGLALLAGDWEAAWNAIKNTLAGVWAGMQLVVDGALAVLTGAIELAWNAITLLTTTAWTAIQTLLGGIWDAIEGKVVEVVGANDETGLRGTIAGAWQSIKDTTETVWGAIGGIIEGVWTGIRQGIARSINDIIDAINGMIDDVEGAIHAIDSFFGRSTWDLPRLDRIPEFAEGGVVPGSLGRPVLALVHGGEEVLTPEQRQSRGRGGNTYQVTINAAEVALDEEALTRQLHRLELLYGGA